MRPRNHDGQAAAEFVVVLGGFVVAVVLLHWVTGNAAGVTYWEQAKVVYQTMFRDIALILSLPF